MAPRIELSKHLATIESYLEDVRSISHKPNRDYFEKYILTSCWVKMHTRAEHWITLGVITSICNISEDSLITAVEAMDDTTVQVDRCLTEYLNGSREPGGYVGETLKYHIHRLNGQFDDPKYNKDFSLDPIMNVKTWKDEKNREVYVYTPAIAVAFHRLLVSSLLAYVFRLQIVNKAVRAFPVVERGDPQTEVIPAFVKLLLSARLLLVVSHSRLFRKHSSLLNGLLWIPTEAHVEMYTQDFAKFKGWHANHVDDVAQIKRIEALATSNNSQPGSTSVQASAVKDSASEESGTTDEVLDNVPDAESGVVYRKWIMGMVDHFASIRVLERVCVRLPREAKINFSIIGLNRPSLSSDWDTMVCAHR